MGELYVLSPRGALKPYTVQSYESMSDFIANAGTKSIRLELPASIEPLKIRSNVAVDSPVVRCGCLWLNGNSQRFQCLGRFHRVSDKRNAARIAHHGSDQCARHGCLCIFHLVVAQKAPSLTEVSGCGKVGLGPFPFKDLLDQSDHRF